MSIDAVLPKDLLRIIADYADGDTLSQWAEAPDAKPADRLLGAGEATRLFFYHQARGEEAWVRIATQLNIHYILTHAGMIVAEQQPVAFVAKQEGCLVPTAPASVAVAGPAPQQAGIARQRTVAFVRAAVVQFFRLHPASGSLPPHSHFFQFSLIQQQLFLGQLRLNDAVRGQIEAEGSPLHCTLLDRRNHTLRKSRSDYFETALRHRHPLAVTACLHQSQNLLDTEAVIKSLFVALGNHDPVSVGRPNQIILHEEESRAIETVQAIFATARWQELSFGECVRALEKANCASISKLSERVRNLLEARVRQMEPPATITSIAGELI